MSTATQQSVFRWTQAIRVDGGIIDAEHRHLIAVARRLFETIDPESEPAEACKVVRELFKYIEYHFRKEEQLMHQCSYLDDKAHKEAHAEIIEKMNAAMKNNANLPDLIETIREIVKQWVFHHITVEDRKLGLHIETHGSDLKGGPVSAASRHAR